MFRPRGSARSRCRGCTRTRASVPGRCTRGALLRDDVLDKPPCILELRSSHAIVGASINRSEIVSNVAARASLSKADADAAVAAVLSTIADALARDETVTIPGFGAFFTRSRGARQGRNPATGEPVAIPASKTATFKAAKELRGAVNRTPA